MTSLAVENPPTLGELGGDCLCGRGPAIGTCIVTASRLWFRAFHEPPAAYHLERCTDWACVDRIADAALSVASGQVREEMRRAARERHPEELPCTAASLGTPSRPSTAASTPSPAGSPPTTTHGPPNSSGAPSACSDPLITPRKNT